MTAIANISVGVRDFPREKYATIADVPVFVEHETTLKDGRKLRFTRRELGQIVDKCNSRIEETGDYAAVVVGHTPDDPARPSDMPELVGFAGPFKPGKLPNGKDAILADFHIRRDSLAAVEKHPRRSPELWLADDYGEMFFDPISLLGAEAPRLDMGMTPLFYSRRRAGQVIETYSAVCPSPGSVMVLSHGEEDEPEKHAKGEGGEVEEVEDEGGEDGGEESDDDETSDDDSVADNASETENNQPTPEHEDSDMALSPEDVQQIVQAIEATDWAQWVKQQMFAGAGAAANAAAAGTPPGTPPAAPPAAPATPPGPPPAESGPTPFPADNPPAEGPPPPKPDDQKQYAAGEDGAGDDAPEPVDTDANREKKMEYAKLKTDVAVLERRLQAVEKYAKEAGDKLESERGRRIDAERRAMLQDKRRAFAFDLDKEIERCRYSKMSDDQFTDHLTLIDENFQRIPVDAMLPDAPGGEADADRPGGKAEKEKFNKAASAKARKIAVAKASRGEPVDYEEILEQVKAGEVK